MREVAIVGAGELGGLVAHVLARRDVVSSIRLVDERGPVAAGKALDIMQAAPLEGFATRLTGSSDLFTAAGADIIVIAEPASDGEWFEANGTTLLRRLGSFARDAIVICAGPAHRELIEHGVRHLGFDRTRLVGSAPEALRSAARALVALDQNVSPQDVSLTVLGVPPNHVVVGWEDGAIGGFGLTRLLSQPAQRRLGARIAALWPVGPYALASAAGKVIDVLCGRTRQLTTCFVAADDSSGTRARAAAMPVRLNRTGMLEVVLPDLSESEQVALDNATKL